MPPPDEGPEGRRSAILRALFSELFRTDLLGPDQDAPLPEDPTPEGPAPEGPESGGLMDHIALSVRTLLSGPGEVPEDLLISLDLDGPGYICAGPDPREEPDHGRHYLDYLRGLRPAHLPVVSPRLTLEEEFFSRSEPCGDP